MSWSSELPSRPNLSGIGWYAGLPARRIVQSYHVVWTSDRAQASIPRALATAALVGPGIASSATVYMPASGDSFPHEFPWEFVTERGSMLAKASMFAPAVGIGPNAYQVPLIGAAAEMYAPSIEYSIVIHMPDAAGFPHQFPWEMLKAQGSMGARGEIMVPGATADAILTAAVMAAEGDNPTPEIMSGAKIAAEIMEAVAGMEIPDISHTSQEDAHADVPTMAASAESVGLAYQFPWVFLPNSGMHKPKIELIWPADAVTSAAGGEMASPGISVSYAAQVPTALASGVLVAPGVTSGASDTASSAGGEAEVIAPTVIWEQPPVLTTFNDSGSFDVSAVRGWATHLVLVGVGGGEAGENGQFLTIGDGGDHGDWNDRIIALADYPSLTSITVTVGNGGASNGANGQATTFTGNGSMPSLSCAGGDGLNPSGSATGLGPGNHAVDGDTYTGGADRTGGNGLAGNAPGGGGTGGGIPLGSGGAGAKGRAWIKAKRVN